MSARAEAPVRSIGTDPAAFTEFYRAHVDEVTRFVARRVADPELAADLTAKNTSAVRSAASSGSATRRATNLVTSSTCAR